MALMPTAGRFPTLSTAYGGFFISDDEEANQVIYTPAPPTVNNSSGGDKPQPQPQPQPVQQIIMSAPPRLDSQAVRHYLGAAAVSDMSYTGPASSQVTLTQMEFGVLCALSGAGVVLLLLHLFEKKQVQAAGG
jgi:hypothetical protein